jgi:aerobic carbon-monoxide dehydrogenase medium subunit
MVTQKFAYTAPKSLDEALALLAGGAKPLAGGMSLIPMMKLRLAAPEHLVDLRRLSGLDYIRESAGQLHIGATATHYDVENAPLLRQKCPLLAETAAAIGDVQVRNMGTVGGSVAHADPSADYPAALQALEARFVLQSANGERTLSAADFFLDAFTTALEAGELVREIIVPIDDARTGTSYKKVAQPASGFAVVGVAARVRQDAGKFSFVRIGITGLSNSAYRAGACERALEGQPTTPGAIRSAAAFAAEGIDANADLHASADYRRHLAVVHTARALGTAVSRIL